MATWLGTSSYTMAIMPVIMTEYEDEDHSKAFLFSLLPSSFNICCLPTSTSTFILFVSAFLLSKDLLMRSSLKGHPRSITVITNKCLVISISYEPISSLPLRIFSFQLIYCRKLQLCTPKLVSWFSIDISNWLSTVPPTWLTWPGISHESHEMSVFTSTAAPGASHLLFAVGTSHGIMSTNKCDYNDGVFALEKGEIDPYASDVFALEFLSDKNPSILLSGGRRGILDIMDLRTPELTRASDAINHPSTITNIRQLDSHHILVAGLHSSLRQYDLRFNKPAASTKPPTRGNRGRAGRPHNPNAIITRPVLEYEGFSNAATIQHGLEVDLETGVLAVAQEHDAVHPPVQLFSIRGGQMLPSPKMDNILHRDQVVKCVDWVGDVEGSSKSLYVLGNGLHRFTWTGDGIDELS
jgi:hypothetical protein